MPRVLLPEPALIQEVIPETADTRTYTFTLNRPFAFLPGQFNMLSLPGIGEAPVSISSDPGISGTFQHTVRSVGNVTRALGRLEEGGGAGIRGPYGTGWPLVATEGRDLVMVAGGIGLAPLRPLLLHVLAHRRGYGRVELLYGARTPADLLYRREYPRWEAGGVTVRTTVDRVTPGGAVAPGEALAPGEAWSGRVGVVTALLDEVEVDPSRAVALVCGPEAMMKAVIRELEGRGFSPERIYLSLERRMECGVAWCGHCQIGPRFVCRDGPVFAYAEIMDLPGWKARGGA